MSDNPLYVHIAFLIALVLLIRIQLIKSRSKKHIKKVKGKTMIEKILFRNLKALNDFVDNANISQEHIINIETAYDRGNPDWGIQFIVLYYFENKELVND